MPRLPIGVGGLGVKMRLLSVIYRYTDEMAKGLPGFTRVKVTPAES